MKAAPFEYVRAGSLDEALDVLARHGGEAKLVAGGQSLVPMMAMRLARPAVLVDINRLDGLRTLAHGAASVTMGAARRQCELERDAELGQRLPLVHQALRWVGHIQTRNRGTVGGSLVHADPSAELPLAAVVLGARLHLRSAKASRTVAAGEFFHGPMFTATEEDECLEAVEWPVWQGTRVGSAFDEVAIRHGDFALASAACQLQIDAEGRCRRASLGLGGVDGTPIASPEAAAMLEGRRITNETAREAAQLAARACQPGEDVHASAEYRRHLAAVLAQRVLLAAAERAAQKSST